ncbi:hypothetical protein SAMN05216436_1398 [bacterium A37T11]|nr:hypothetical protein SAMN05216436_1398 [bacterium A37T11]
MASHLYEGIWGKILPRIVKQLKETPEGSTLQLVKMNFETVGNRPKSHLYKTVVITPLP